MLFHAANAILMKNKIRYKTRYISGWPTTFNSLLGGTIRVHMVIFDQLRMKQRLAYSEKHQILTFKKLDTVWLFVLIRLLNVTLLINYQI